MKNKQLVKRFEKTVRMTFTPWDKVDIKASVSVYKVERSLFGFKFKPKYRIEKRASFIENPVFDCEYVSNEKLKMELDEMIADAKYFIDQQKKEEN